MSGPLLTNGNPNALEVLSENSIWLKIDLLQGYKLISSIMCKLFLKQLVVTSLVANI